MTDIDYEIVEHDGGWAYRVRGSYSETFRTREAAHRAADEAAHRQERPDPGGQEILFEDRDSRWRDEYASGADRPHTRVED